MPDEKQLWTDKYEPHSLDEVTGQQNVCLCGCNQIVKLGRSYISGHNLKVKNPFKDKRHTLKTKQKISNTKRGCVAWNKDVHQWQDKPHPKGMLNKHHTQETKSKISKSSKGRGKGIPKSPEAKLKMSIAKVGKKPSLETRKLWSKQRQKNKHPLWGKHHSKETVEKIRQSNIGHVRSLESRLKQSKSISGKNNHEYGKLPSVLVSHGRRTYYFSPLQGTVCFRSSYELAYAKYLDQNKILWLYELETFELSNNTTYTPDFFLPQFEKFIEVKGYMRSTDKEKIKLFLSEYPFDLEIVGKDIITSIKKGDIYVL